MSGVSTVLLVDDHAMVMEALAEHLERASGLKVVGTAPDADTAIDKALSTRPDVIVMDIDMPGLISFDAASRLQSLLPDTRVIFLSAFTHDHYIQQALSVKARAYVTKGEPLNRVIEAIRTVARGGTFYSREVRDRLLVDSGRVELPAENTRVGVLSEREIQVLRYIASGMSKKEIANTMHLSVKTVENHSTNLMSKLNIHDRVELTRFAIREKLAEA